jgi:hypothetical protein
MQLEFARIVAIIPASGALGEAEANAALTAAANAIAVEELAAA